MQAKWFYEAANAAARRAILARRGGLDAVPARREAAEFRALARQLASQDQRQA